MVRLANRSALVALSLVCLGFWSAGICAGATAKRAAATSPSTLAAANLTQQALDAELVGDSKLRGELLAKAIAADPDFAPARWQNGQVKFQGEWKTIAEVGQHVSGNPRWAEYGERRRDLTGDVTEPMELAQ